MTMRVDLSVLGTARPALVALGNDLGEIAHTLAACLDAEGLCWGADEMGVAFAGQYVPAAAQIRAVLADVHESMAAIGAAIGDVIDSVTDAEGRAENRFGEG